MMTEQIQGLAILAIELGDEELLADSAVIEQGCGIGGCGGCR